MQNFLHNLNVEEYTELLNSDFFTSENSKSSPLFEILGEAIPFYLLDEYMYRIQEARHSKTKRILCVQMFTGIICDTLATYHNTFPDQPVNTYDYLISHYIEYKKAFKINPIHCRELKNADLAKFYHSLLFQIKDPKQRIAMLKPVLRVAPKLFHNKKIFSNAMLHTFYKHELLSAILLSHPGNSALSGKINLNDELLQLEENTRAMLKNLPTVDMSTDHEFTHNIKNMRDFVNESSYKKGKLASLAEMLEMAMKQENRECHGFKEGLYRTLIAIASDIINCSDKGARPAPTGKTAAFLLHAITILSVQVNGIHFPIFQNIGAKDRRISVTDYDAKQTVEDDEKCSNQGEIVPNNDLSSNSDTDQNEEIPRLSNNHSAIHKEKHSGNNTNVNNDLLENITGAPDFGGL